MLKQILIAFNSLVNYYERWRKERLKTKIKGERALAVRDPTAAFSNHFGGVRDKPGAGKSVRSDSPDT